MPDLAHARHTMVARQIAARGIADPLVIAAMRTVPREAFVPERLREFSYEDAPLPIEESQTISQPYIVALMAEAARIRPGEHVLEVGAGSGYASAILGQVASDVHAIERHAALAALAAERMDRLGYGNVHVVQGDGTLGLPEHAPYDAIIVSAGGPDVPDPLLRQLRIGGRLIIPVGDQPRSQELIRVTRTGEHEFERETLGSVSFVPLIGTEGWSADGTAVTPRRTHRPLRIRESRRDALSALVARSAEPIDDLERTPIDALVRRLAHSKVVLIGESTHGTSEFYRFRARLTRELIEHHGFRIVALEADWPDTSVVDQRVRGREVHALREVPFSRFPRWMWRNAEMRSFIAWLGDHNRTRALMGDRTSIHGLDVYSLNNSIGAVLDYLGSVDPETAASARVRYGCFSPWESDPATYGRAVTGGRMTGCESEAVAILTDLLAKRLAYFNRDGDRYFDAARNATVVREAERYYRAMYWGSRESWNLRDRHMMDTLESVLTHRGPDARAVVWAHNSHVGDASATEMGTRGETNLGELARKRFGSAACLVGMGTHTGTVAAADNWGDPVRIMTVQPSHADSYERICHDTGLGGFSLHLRHPDDADIRGRLLPPHLERAIGVIYRPDTEMLSHYFEASLARQFDEWIWFDRTSAVEPLPGPAGAGLPDTYPFGL
jgi:protein-L-isoaspartate(D-aspartate) O-methyltransferase